MNTIPPIPLLIFKTVFRCCRHKPEVELVMVKRYIVERRKEDKVKEEMFLFLINSKLYALPVQFTKMLLYRVNCYYPSTYAQICVVDRVISYRFFPDSLFDQPPENISPPEIIYSGADFEGEQTAYDKIISLG